MKRERLATVVLFKKEGQKHTFSGVIEAPENQDLVIPAGTKMEVLMYPEKSKKTQAEYFKGPVYAATPAAEQFDADVPN